MIFSVPDGCVYTVAIEGLALESTLLARGELAKERLVVPFLRSAANMIYVGHVVVYPAYRYGNTMISRCLAWLLQELAGAAPGGGCQLDPGTR